MFSLSPGESMCLVMVGMARCAVPARVVAGGMKYSSTTAIRKSCAAARGADIAARCPISINLTSRKNSCCARQLHWSGGADHAQSAGDGSATAKKMTQLHCGNYDRQKGVTRFQHQSPTTHCLATRIPRGKKSLLPVRAVPTIAPSIFWPASTPERIDHHSWERARHPTNSSVA